MKSEDPSVVIPALTVPKQGTITERPYSKSAFSTVLLAQDKTLIRERRDLLDYSTFFPVVGFRLLFYCFSGTPYDHAVGITYTINITSSIPGVEFCPIKFYFGKLCPSEGKSAHCKLLLSL